MKNSEKLSRLEDALDSADRFFKNIRIEEQCRVNADKKFLSLAKKALITSVCVSALICAGLYRFVSYMHDAKNSQEIEERPYIGVNYIPDEDRTGIVYLNDK